jgi:hypothetical protein
MYRNKTGGCSVTDKELLRLFDEVVVPACRAEMVKKNADYTAGKAEEDGLANFNMIGMLNGDGAMKTWLTYYLKHTMAIIKYVRTGRVESEGIFGRFVDSINYCFLGYAIVMEQQKKVTAVNKTCDKVVQGDSIKIDPEFHKGLLEENSELLQSDVAHAAYIQELRDEIKQLHKDLVMYEEIPCDEPPVHDRPVPDIEGQIDNTELHMHREYADGKIVGFSAEKGPVNVPFAGTVEECMEKMGEPCKVSLNAEEARRRLARCNSVCDAETRDKCDKEGYMPMDCWGKMNTMKHEGDCNKCRCRAVCVENVAAAILIHRGNVDAEVITLADGRAAVIIVDDMPFPPFAEGDEQQDYIDYFRTGHRSSQCQGRKCKLFVITDEGLPQQKIECTRSQDRDALCPHEEVILKLQKCQGCSRHSSVVRCDRGSTPRDCFGNQYVRRTMDAGLACDNCLCQKHCSAMTPVAKEETVEPAREEPDCMSDYTEVHRLNEVRCCERCWCVSKCKATTRTCREKSTEGKYDDGRC